MALLEKQLFIKRSTIPAAGKGLFTKKAIKKGTLIIEYKGKITTWKEIVNNSDFNAYVYYINRNRVIDSKPFKKYLARYSNDAKGLCKTKGITNNCQYKEHKGLVFIESIKDIEAGKEILVPYGKEYWDAIKYNNKLAAKNARAGK